MKYETNKSSTYIPYSTVAYTTLNFITKVKLRLRFLICLTTLYIFVENLPCDHLFESKVFKVLFSANSSYLDTLFPVSGSFFTVEIFFSFFYGQISINYDYVHATVCLWNGWEHKFNARSCSSPSPYLFIIF